ncbi:hypothetical protein ACFYO2_48810 [Streptomyces sp. NPDC006602]|uniref:hypothetical protein n=1 Tax=Streptomyces sp. NPDC006602 TaxID=3364751 RepID=UPI00368BA3BC
MKFLFDDAAGMARSVRARWFVRHGEPRRVHDGLGCETELTVFTAAEGAGEHLREGTAPGLRRRVFDRLDDRPARA